MADIRPGYFSELEAYCSTYLQKFRMRSNGQWGDCSCPYHEDSSPSCRVSFASDKGAGKVVCSSTSCPASGEGVYIDIVAKDCSLPDPPKKTDWKPTGKKKKSAKSKDPDDDRYWPVVAEYAYPTEDGDHYAVVLRKEKPDKTDKTFRQKFWNPKAKKWEWSKNLSTGETQPYILWRLPELSALKEGSNVLVVEGEKDVLTAEKLGLVATCPMGGAGGAHHVKDWSPLEDKNVVIVVDNDQAGRELADRLLPLILPHARAVKVVDLCDEAGWNKVVEKRRDATGKTIPQKDEGKDLTDWVNEGGTKERLIKLAKSTPVYDGSIPAAPTPAKRCSKAKPEVQINGRDPEIVDAEILNLLADTGKFFTRAGAVVMIDEDDFRNPILTTVKKDRMAKEITETMKLVEVKWKDGDETKKIVRPDRDIVSAAMVGGVKTFHPLVKIVETPFFDQSGRLVCTPGYDEKTAVWYAPFDPNLKIDMNPSKAKVDKAMRFLWEEFFQEFAFYDETSITHAFCSLFHPFLSEFIADKTPAYLFSANRSGTGKSYLAECISMVSSSTGAHSITESKNNEEEVRKSLDAGLLQGKTLIMLDNIESQMRWPWWQGYITMPIIYPRTLGKSETTPILNRHWWAITANSPKLWIDTVRRTIPIKLHLNLEDPSDRKFAKEDLQGWVRTNRARLMEACVTILQGWMAAGATLSDSYSLTSFSRWAKIFGGLCDWLGLPGFLATQKTHLMEINDDATERREILDELHRKHGNINQAEYRFYLNSLIESDLLPRKYAGKCPESNRRSFSMWLKNMWEQYPICSGYLLSWKRCPTLNKNVFSLRKIEQDVNEDLPEPLREVPVTRFRFRDGIEKASSHLRNLVEKTQGSGKVPGEVPVEVPASKNPINTTSKEDRSNSIPEPRNLNGDLREIHGKDAKSTQNASETSHVTMYVGDKGSRFRGSGNDVQKSVQKIEHRSPDLDPSDPRVQHRIRQLESAIQSKLLFGQMDHVKKLRGDLDAFKARIKPATPAPPPEPPKSAPTPQEVARRDREEIEALSDLLGPMF